MTTAALRTGLLFSSRMTTKLTLARGTRFFFAKPVLTKLRPIRPTAQIRAESRMGEKTCRDSKHVSKTLSRAQTGAHRVCPERLNTDREGVEPVSPLLREVITVPYTSVESLRE